MNNLKLKIIQVLTEAALPILGFLFWKWTFYYILLFYLLDFFAASILTIFKIKKINSFQLESKKEIENFKIINWVFPVIVNIGILFCVYFLLSNLNPTFDIYKETVNFVMLEDMGMAQGIFLIPLVFYASYLNYKMQFLMPKKYQFLTVKNLYKHYFKGILVALTGFLLAFLISFFVSIPEIICVISLVLSFAIYSFFEKNKI